MILPKTTPPPSLFALLEFASLPMLGWLVAALLPWLIHRWQRRQHQSTPWAAIELLQRAMQQHGQRVRIQQWLLLAIRTCLFLLIAFAVAEPALQQWAVGKTGIMQTHRIIVLDQSYSMGCEQSETSRWQRAQSHTRHWIENNEGNTLTLIGWTEQAENLLGRPTAKPAIALAALEDLHLSQESADLAVVFRAILAAMDRSEAEMPQITAHQVVLCTDLGRQTWGVDESQSELLKSVAKRAEVIIVNVAEGPNSNLAITDLATDPVMTLRQRQATITATVACYGEIPTASTDIELLVDGHRVAQKQVDLRKNAEQTVSFSHRFVEEGPHTLQVVLANNKDCLPNDDKRWQIVNVQKKLQVACLAGQLNASDDLARALAPSSGLSESGGAIRPERYPISRLNELDLASYDAVLLGSVGQLSPRESATLRDYVRQGGGLAIFLGEETLPSLQEFLPVRIDAIQSPGEYQFDPLGYRHPVVSPFRGRKQTGLLGVAILQYRRLLVREKHPSAEIVLNFNTGDPALVIDRFGLGRVAVLALPASLEARTSAGTPWSSFALSPGFLPVVRELVSYLVGDRWLQQRNLLVGNDAVILCDVHAKSSAVRFPNGMHQSLPPQGAEDGRQTVFHETQQCGVYHFYTDEKESARFAVNLSGLDSDLRSIDPAALPEGFMTGTAKGSGRRKLLSAGTNSKFSLVRILLACILGLLLLEPGLAWMFGKGWV